MFRIYFRHDIFWDHDGKFISDNLNILQIYLHEIRKNWALTLIWNHCSVHNVNSIMNMCSY